MLCLRFLCRHIQSFFSLCGDSTRATGGVLWPSNSFSWFDLVSSSLMASSLIGWFRDGSVLRRCFVRRAPGFSSPSYPLEAFCAEPGRWAGDEQNCKSEFWNCEYSWVGQSKTFNFTRTQFLFSFLSSFASAEDSTVGREQRSRNDGRNWAFPHSMRKLTGGIDLLQSFFSFWRPRFGAILFVSF